MGAIRVKYRNTDNQAQIVCVDSIGRNEDGTIWLQDNDDVDEAYLQSVDKIDEYTYDSILTRILERGYVDLTNNGKFEWIDDDDDGDEDDDDE